MVGQEGATPNVPHDQMMREYVVKEAGYAYVYISNDNPTQVDVYFDEVSITHTPTNIIQYNEYYPFGLQAGTSWTRENNKNDYLYNEGSELNAVSGWYETFFRSYDPVLGRFMQVDPLVDVTPSMSAYQYAGNSPVVFNDPSGLLYRPRDNQAPHWDLSSLPIWTGSRDEWSDQSGGGGGAQFAWNPLGGEEISREEWLERGGDPNVHADHYYPGAWEIQFGAESGAAQQEDQEWLRTFLMENFGDEIRGLNRLAQKNGQKIAWWIDVEGKYASDPGIPGDTRQIREKQTTYISIHAFPLAKAMTGDTRLLYVVVAHELVHATDIVNGNRDLWDSWYGKEISHRIMEHHAYTRSAEIEKQLGVNYGGSKMLFDLVVPDNYLDLK